LVHRAVADRIAFSQQLPVDAGSGQTLLGRGLRLSLGHRGINT
jgi:hypothetical protein